MHLTSVITKAMKKFTVRGSRYERQGSLFPQFLLLSTVKIINWFDIVTNDIYVYKWQK